MNIINGFLFIFSMSWMQVKAECEKENSVHECKQGKINGSEDSNTILENEDYIYTQSLP